MGRAHYYSLVAWLACAAFLLAVNVLYYPKWKMPHTEATLSWDVSGYYLYLPALFVYQDLKQAAFLEEVRQKYLPAPGLDQVFEHESGSRVMKYSAGLAVQYLPFFLAAHALAELLGYPADGFSRPYQLAISLGSLLVAILGLWFLRRVLLHYFRDRSVAVVLLLLVFATNYLDYSAINGAMTHNYLFTLYALLAWLSMRFYQAPSAGKALGIGLLLGLMALTRPTEAIAALIPLFWGVPHWQGLRERLGFLMEKWRWLALAALACLAVGSLQLMYWKYATGSWLVYSYQDQGFSWLSPHLKNGLFSYRAGWLVYTPAMAFALLGFITLYRQHRQLFWPILAFSLLFLYITFAWDIWWYGGSLGQRAMVQSYAILAFPLASFAELALSRRARACFFGAFCLFFAYYNLWWTHQAHRGGLFASEQMNKGYFWSVLLRYDVPKEALKLLDTRHIFEGERKEARLVYQNDFEADTARYDCPLPAIEGERSLCLTAEQQFSPAFAFPLERGDYQWLRAAATFRCAEKEWDTWRMAQFVVRFKREGQTVRENVLRVHRFLQNEDTRDIHIDCKFPRQPFDEAEIFFWNADGNKPLAIDRLRVEVYKER